MPDNHLAQQDIGSLLCQLLPVEGSPKTLQELRDQVRLLKRITDPSDDRLARVILGYLDSPRHTHGVRFLKVDTDASPLEISARWTRVRIGPRIDKTPNVSRGLPPNPALIQRELAAIWARCTSSHRTSFFIWDLLEEHFSINKSNNSYYLQWILALSDALKSDQRFIIVAVDPENGIPVQWMVAVDRQAQVADAVRVNLPQLIAFMARDHHLLHLTRDLVQRFFPPRAADDTYDVHAYYNALSGALALTAEARRLFVREADRSTEAWCLANRVPVFIHQRLDAVHAWLLSTNKPAPLAAIALKCFRGAGELTSVDPLTDEVAAALRQDLRFLPLPRDAGWQAIPPGPTNNLAAYHVLWHEAQPLTQDALLRLARRRFPSAQPEFTLPGDDRFLPWRAAKWGLSYWIDINDWAYEYLRMTATPSDRAKIVTRVCYPRGIAKAVAFFLPEDDPRFVQHSDGTWYYHRPLTDAELDQMADLLRANPEGLTIDELVSQVTGLQPCDTDAAARIAADDRFAIVDGRCFASDLRYRLSDQDLATMLAVLEKAATLLTLATLVRRALHCDADLTDAQERLRDDPRFDEVLPQVWAAASLHIRLDARRPASNVPIRSRSAPALTEEDYSSLQDLTLREAGPRGQTKSVCAKQLTRTLSPLDIRHGSLVIDRFVGALLEVWTGSAIELRDERDAEFTCWIDRDHKLLHGLGPWLADRGLTFGDKITLATTAERGFIQIRPTGQRDERVYQEGLRRQDAERLAQAGRHAGKSYHDLIIDVMQRLSDRMGEPAILHRETIYELVDQDRTASRGYIFSLLSLSGCPYNELRYFVPHGDGFWSFDPDRKRAFDMKMTELVARVAELEATNAQLTAAAAVASGAQGHDRAEVARLTERTRDLESQIARLGAENERLLSARATLEERAAAQEQKVAQLAGRISILEDDKGRLEAVVADQQKRIGTLTQADNAARERQAALEEEKGRLEAVIADQQQRIDTLAQADEAARQQQAALEEDKRRLDAVIAEQQQQIESLTQADSTARHRQATLEADLARERAHAAHVAQQLARSQKESVTKAQQTSQSAVEFDMVRVALNMPLGRLFVLLSRWLGGPDLSKL